MCPTAHANPSLRYLSNTACFPLLQPSLVSPFPSISSSYIMRYLSIRVMWSPPSQQHLTNSITDEDFWFPTKRSWFFFLSPHKHSYISRVNPFETRSAGVLEPLSNGTTAFGSRSGNLLLKRLKQHTSKFRMPARLLQHQLLAPTLLEQHRRTKPNVQGYSRLVVLPALLVSSSGVALTSKSTISANCMYPHSGYSGGDCHLALDGNFHH